MCLSRAFCCCHVLHTSISPDQGVSIRLLDTPPVVMVTMRCQPPPPQGPESRNADRMRSFVCQSGCAFAAAALTNDKLWPRQSHGELESRERTCPGSNRTLWRSRRSRGCGGRSPCSGRPRFLLDPMGFGGGGSCDFRPPYGPLRPLLRTHPSSHPPGTC